MLDSSYRGGYSPLPTQSFAARRHAEHETLALYVLGDLSVRATLATQEHLSSCAQCKERLPGIRAVIAALRPAQA
jgi:anti-sigma factor RsiW